MRTQRDISEYADKRVMPVSTENLRRTGRWLLWCSASWLLACNDPSGTDRLQLQLSSMASPAEIGTGCAEACERAVLAVQLSYPDEMYAPRETIELLQYRIDFALGSQLAGMPYFAGPLSLVMAPGQTQELKLTAAGAAQRAYVESVGGQTPLSGQAKLTLAGYDWDDRQVFLSSSFDVRFAPASDQVANDE